jgi:tetratricopeptide (TPR) repeat protein
MSPHYQRACLLFQQSRYDMAAQELRLALAQEPNRPDYHGLLALCLIEQEQFDAATEEAQRAIGLGPDVPYSHFVMSRVMLERNRLNEAREAIQESIRLDPEDADYFHQLAAIELNARKWQAALDAAELGLQLDPENVGCTNLRVRALAQLGRKIDADAAVEAALQRAPENAFTHANRGWTLLEQGNPQKAMEHFREALRLDPTMDWARQGIVESLKAKHFIYRWMLMYFLWMSRLSRQVQWGIILGGYFGYRFLDNLAEENPAFNVVARPVLIAYIIFALLTWLAVPLFNTLLRFNQYGRLVLSSEQVMASNLVCAALVPALGCGAYFLVTGDFRLGLLGIFLGAISMASAAIFPCDGGWPRRAMIGYTALLAALVLIWAVSIFLSMKPPPGVSMTLILMLLGLPFAANVFAQASPKR